MSGFWTCGPFKEAEDRRDRMNHRALQLEKLMEIIENIQQLEDQIVSGSLEDKYIGLMMKQDAERDLNTILGIKPDERKEEDTEVFGKALLESITGSTED